MSTAIILSIAGVVGETGPLLFTSFGSLATNLDPAHGTTESLPQSPTAISRNH